ncbi:MAG: hypothetical protein HY369_03740 [Candidatus Aenigmarchaeota archaeon]|nr:hypothetical protein [Candidatus Aenigmarchaeota archaeon]
MKRYQFSDVLTSPEFSGLPQDGYRMVAWGYVTRETGDGKDLLVAIRAKPDDPMRARQLVLPGGGVRKDDLDGYRRQLTPEAEALLTSDDVQRRSQAFFNLAHFHTARREVLEETGVKTEFGDGGQFNNLSPHPVLKRRGPVVSLYDPRDGYVWLYYRDSGKAYVGQVADLLPRSAIRPKGGASDAVQPHYLRLEEAMERSTDFTPACQVLLELAHQAEGFALIKPGDVVLSDERIRLGMKPPE